MSESEELTSIEASEYEATVAALKERKAAREGNAAPAPLRADHRNKARDFKSDLKKATGFAKRFRNFTEKEEAAIMKDLSTINVSKFASEAGQGVGPAVFETKLKAAEIPALARCCSAMNVRHEDFFPEAMAGIKKMFQLDPVLEEVHEKMDAATADCSRLRVAVRLMCEFFLLGLLPSPALFTKILHQMATAADAAPKLPKKIPPHVTPNMLQIATIIARTVGIEILGTTVTDPEGTECSVRGHGGCTRNMSDKDSSPVELDDKTIAAAKGNCKARLEATKSMPVCTPEEGKDFAAKLTKFLQLSTTLCAKYKNAVEGKWRQMCEQTEMRGDVTDEVKESLTSLKRDADRCYVLVESLVQMTGLDSMMPQPIDLSRALASSSTDQSVVFGSKLAEFYTVKECENVRHFDDEAERAFYEEYIAIDHLVPDDTGGQRVKLTESDANQDPTLPPTIESERREGLDYTNAEALLLKLHQCAAKEYVDEWIVEFLNESTRMYRDASAKPQQAPAYFHNCRRMLLTSLRFAPTNSSEMLPFLARVVATFNGRFPDMGEVLIGKLEGELVHAIKSKQCDSFMRKMRNSRYLAELVKCRVAPPIRVFRTMNLCLDEFGNQTNVEIFSCLLEHAGPYFMRGGLTRVRVEECLKRAQELRFNVTISAEREMKLDSAVLATKTALRPKTARVVVCRPVTPLELYVRHLLFSVLSKKAFRTVQEKMRMLPWGDPERAEQVVRQFRKAHRCSWDRIHLLVELLADTTEVHGWVAPRICDLVLEDLREDLEIPGRRAQQKRLQDLKLLGELYNFRLIGFRVLAYVYLQLLFYKPTAELPTDYARIRALCTLFDTTGTYFLTKPSKTILQQTRFIVAHFYVEVHSKLKPLPMDLDFKVAEAIGNIRQLLRKHLSADDVPVFPSTAKEAAEVVKKTTTGTSREAWFDDLVKSMTGVTKQQRLFPVLETSAPEIDEAEVGDGPRETPIEAAAADASSSEDDDDDDFSSDEEDSDEDDFSDEDDEEDDEEEDWSSSDEEDSDSDFDSLEDSDESGDEDEEEEAESNFVMPTLGRGAFGAMRVDPNAAAKELTEDDKAFEDALREVLHDSMADASKRGFTRNIERNVEGRMGVQIRPVAQKAKETAGALKVAAAAAQPEKKGDAPAAPQKFAVLRRHGGDKVEAHRMYVPADREFARHSASLQEQHQEEREELLRRTIAINSAQQAEELSSARGGRGGWRGGRGYRGGRGW